MVVWLFTKDSKAGLWIPLEKETDEKTHAIQLGVQSIQ